VKGNQVPSGLGEDCKRNEKRQSKLAQICRYNATEKVFVLLGTKKDKKKRTRRQRERNMIARHVVYTCLGAGKFFVGKLKNPLSFSLNVSFSLCLEDWSRARCDCPLTFT